MYGIHLNEDNVNDETYRHIISKNLIRSFVASNNSFSDYAILLFRRPDLFLEKVHDALYDRGMEGGIGFVKYDDHEYKYDEETITSREKAIGACFHKRKRYAEQSEYRIVVINEGNVALSDFFIGELEKKDYSLISIEQDKDFEIAVKMKCLERTEDTATIRVGKLTTRFI